MPFRIFNQKKLIAGQATPNPDDGLSIFNTRDEKLIEAVANDSQQNAIGLRVYNTETQYTTVY